MDRNLNDLLKWSIENTPQSNGTENTTNGDHAVQEDTRPRTQLNQDALRSLMGGPSDADLMRESMTVILSPEVRTDDKLTAWENLEMLVQNLDNANNLDALAMWPPLVQQLGVADAEERAMAAWTIGTAVQNNEKTQEKLLSYQVIEPLVNMATQDADKTAKKKAVYALSSGVRNFPAGLDEFLKYLPAEFQPAASIQASDMDAIDDIMTKLREKAQQ